MRQIRQYASRARLRVRRAVNAAVASGKQVRRNSNSVEASAACCEGGGHTPGSEAAARQKMCGSVKLPRAAQVEGRVERMPREAAWLACYGRPAGEAPVAQLG